MRVCQLAFGRSYNPRLPVFQVVHLYFFLGAAHVSSKPTMKIEADGSVTGVDESICALREAVRLGVNLIDTSPYYGHGLSERIVGQVG